MDFTELLASLDADTCERLRRALELGRWPDGRVVTTQQRELCMQAVIAYDYRHRETHERVGYIDKGPKSSAMDGQRPLSWRECDGKGGSEGD